MTERMFRPCQRLSLVLKYIEEDRAFPRPFESF